MTRCISMAVVGLALVASLGRAADEANPRDAAKKDLARLQGTWTLVSLESEGEASSPEQIEGFTATYEGDSLTLKAKETVRRRGIVTLNPSRTPKAINTWDQNGPYEDQTVAGIYEFDGDTLKLCFSRPGEARPMEFSTKKGPGFLMVVYKKQKP